MSPSKWSEIKCNCESIIVPTHLKVVSSVDDLELSVRLYNSLKHKNVDTLTELLMLTPEELSTFRNFGKASLLELRNILCSRGLFLRGDYQTCKEVLSPTYDGVWKDIFEDERDKPLTMLNVLRLRNAISKLSKYQWLVLKSQYDNLTEEERHIVSEAEYQSGKEILAEIKSTLESIKEKDVVDSIIRNHYKGVPLYKLKFKRASIDALMYSNIKSVGELINHTSSGLYALPAINKEILLDVEQVLNEAGLCLASEQENVVLIRSSFEEVLSELLNGKESVINALKLETELGKLKCDDEQAYEVVRMYCEGISLTDIAVLLGVSSVDVKEKLDYAVSYLRAMLNIKLVLKGEEFNSQQKRFMINDLLREYVFTCPPQILTPLVNKVINSVSSIKSLDDEVRKVRKGVSKSDLAVWYEYYTNCGNCDRLLNEVLRPNYDVAGALSVINKKLGYAVLNEIELYSKLDNSLIKLYRTGLYYLLSRGTTELDNYRTTKFLQVMHQWNTFEVFVKNYTKLIEDYGLNPSYRKHWFSPCINLYKYGKLENVKHRLEQSCVYWPEVYTDDLITKVKLEDNKNINIEFNDDIRKDIMANLPFTFLINGFDYSPDDLLNVAKALQDCNSLLDFRKMYLTQVEWGEITEEEFWYLTSACFYNYTKYVELYNNETVSLYRELCRKELKWHCSNIHVTNEFASLETRRLRSVLSQSLILVDGIDNMDFESYCELLRKVVDFSRQFKTNEEFENYMKSIKRHKYVSSTQWLWYVYENWSLCEISSVTEDTVDNIVVDIMAFSAYLCKLLLKDDRISKSTESIS